MSNVVIDIAAEFTGKKAFKQAETSTDKLNKTVGNLAKGLIAAFGAKQILNYSKASIKAYAADEAAAARLTKSVENLGLGFEDQRIKSFISNLEATAHVSDDILRPAFQSLLQTTGSVAQSQELLKLALDVSAGSGIDAAQVSKDLGLAYLGQTKGLAKYETGLTKAELQAADFNTIQGALNKQFSGQNSARLDTYAGKMDAVNVALGNAQETIGKGLLDAFVILGGDQGIGSVTTEINNMASSAADAIVGVSLLVAELEKIPVIGGILSRLDNPLGLPKDLLVFGQGGLFDQLGALKNKPKPFGTPMTISGSSDSAAKADKLRKLAEEEAKKRALELLKIKQKQLDTEKKSLAAKKLANAIDKANLMLGKGDNVFDLDKIQLNAALINQAQLLGKATDAAQVLQIANDTARLNVKRSILALEDAIAAKDEAAILAATKKLEEDLKILGALGSQKTQMSAIESILNGLNAKDLIKQSNLDETLAKLRTMLDLLNKLGSTTITLPKLGGGTDGAAVGGGFIQTPNGISPTTEPRSVAEINAAVEAISGVVSVIGDNGKEFIKLVESAAPVFQGLEDSVAKNLFIAQGILTQPFDAGSFRTAEGGSIFNSGAVGARDRNFNITVNTGVGDPNAIAEAVTQVIQDAVDRGTLRSERFQ
jgi:hypothetical protein